MNLQSACVLANQSSRTHQSVRFARSAASPAVSDRGSPSPGFVIGRAQVTNRDPFKYWPNYYPFNPPWHHDFPDADDLLTNLLDELTGTQIGHEKFEVVRLDSDDVFKYPFLYMSEPGFWFLTPKEISNLGEYIRRGGFILCDDFRTGRFFQPPDVEEIEVLRRYLKLAVPERELVKLDARHPIFHTMFDVNDLNMETPYPIPGNPEFWGLMDEKGELQLIAGYNNDLGDYWKFLDEGDKPLKDSSKAVRLGMNFVVYALSH